MRCKRKSVICTCCYLCFCAYSSSVELLLGLQQSVWCVFSPFILSRIGLTISVPTLPISRKALHLPTQSFATVHAKLCNRQRKALHPPTQSFASAHANVCLKTRLHLGIPSPCFPLSPTSTTKHVCKKTRQYV